ncbi:hypothetical protein [Desulfuromonas sp. TF]|uniref:hypothetical protein n=1 Tax=Desulfuromonas sp. TF TaxID=1232410 RepID=UPI000429DB35|nr:hypothetical protein [Desulfuromonas sp. TF]
MKKAAIAIIALYLFALPAFAQNINGEYPICKTQQDIMDFAQAKVFSDIEKMTEMVVDGRCVFVEPDIKAQILEPNMFPKVLVFIPYKSPITGYTSQDNFK